MELARGYLLASDTQNPAELAKHNAGVAAAVKFCVMRSFFPQLIICADDGRLARRKRHRRGWCCVNCGSRHNSLPLLQKLKMFLSLSRLSPLCALNFLIALLFETNPTAGNF